MKIARYHQTRLISTGLFLAIASLVLCFQLSVFTSQSEAVTVDLTRVSLDLDGAATNHSSSFPQISDDGRYTVYESFASDLVPLDTNNRKDVFLYDRITASTTLI